MKNKKFDLETIKVKSFTTSLDENNSQTVKGGIDTRPECLQTGIGNPCLSDKFHTDCCD